MIQRRPPWWLEVGVVLMTIGFVWVAHDLGHGKATSADWLAAMATLAAFYAAVLAGWYVARAYDVELKRERDRDIDTQRAQAAQVAAWIHNPISLWLSNPSSLPIWDVRFRIHIPGAQVIEADPIPLLSPSDQPRDVLIEVDSASIQSLVGWFNRSGSVSEVAAGWPMVEIRFRDAAGRYWVRQADGRLADTAPPA